MTIPPVGWGRGWQWVQSVWLRLKKFLPVGGLWECGWESGWGEEEVKGKAGQIGTCEQAGEVEGSLSAVGAGSVVSSKGGTALSPARPVGGGGRNIESEGGGRAASLLWGRTREDHSVREGGTTGRQLQHWRGQGALKLYILHCKLHSVHTTLDLGVCCTFTSVHHTLQSSHTKNTKRH